METLLNLVTGRDLSPELRVWSALMPALLVSAYFIVGMIVWSIKCALFGVEKDEETLRRGSSVIMGFYLRHYYFWLMKPLWGFLSWARVPPTCITTFSALVGLGSGFAAAAGRFALAGWLFIFSGILDTFDGRIARSRGLSTTWGAAIDSTLDRYADFAILIGMAWYYRTTWVLIPTLLMMMGVALVPYIRARGEALGVKVTGGLMQRAERTMYLGVSLALSPVLEAIFWPEAEMPMHWMTVIALVIIALMTNWTALTRLYTLVDALKRGKSATAEAEREARGERGFFQKLGLNAMAAILATVADFLVVLALVETVSAVRLSPGVATALGCVVGGILNFTLNRIVTFRSKDALAPQIGRYFGVSLGSMILNAFGVALVTSLPEVDYRVSWWLVRGLVFLLWNYPLHSSYVFGDEKPAEASAMNADSAPTPGKATS